MTNVAAMAHDPHWTDCLMRNSRGVPLGNYRFHVDGHGWTLDSQPFAVVQGGLAPSAMKVNNVITVTTSWLAPKGWRLR